MTTMNEKAQDQIDLFNAMRQVEYGDRFAEQEKEVRRHPDTGRIISEGARDDALTVKFTTEQFFSKVKTFQNGGEPSFVAQDMITITNPGTNDVLHAPVTDYYQWRFPVEWDNFKRGQAGELIGTPIEEWSEITPSQVKELQHANVYTVEQIAAMSDGSGGVRGLFALKTKAKHFLASKKDVDAKADADKRFAEQEERHAEQMAAMRAEFAAMLAEATGKGKKSRPDES